MAKAKPKMSMVIPLFPIDGEDKLKDANGDPRFKLTAKAKTKMPMATPPVQLTAKVKSKIPMVIPLIQIGGKGEVKDANCDSKAPRQKVSEG